MIGIFLDVETNGLSVLKHRIIEIAFKLIDLIHQNEIASYNSIVSQPKEIWEKSDPESLKVNGFEFNMLKSGKTENQVALEIHTLFKKHGIVRKEAVYICQNPSFDRSFFGQLIDPSIQEKNLWPYHWLDLASMFWALQLKKHFKENAPLPWQTGISKDKIANVLKLPPEAHPHRAMQGVEHLVDCYFALNAKR